MIDFNQRVKTMSDYKKYVCRVCGHIYDEAIGDVGANILPGTRWEDVPESWYCPECGVAKNEYTMIN
jgi:rubredoxin